MPPQTRAPRRRIVEARPALLGAALGALTFGALLTPDGARAAVLEVTPGLSAGVTDNATGAASDQVQNRYEAYSTVRGSAAMVLTEASATHRLGYTFQLTGYAQTTGASNTGSGNCLCR